MFNKIGSMGNFFSGQKKPFCYAPFGSLYFSQNGNVVACCQNRMYFLGNYPENTVKEIWQGEKIQRLRKHMMDHELNRGCFCCDPQGEGNKLNLQYDFLNKNTRYPRHFIFQLSNLCNLKCIMCNRENSVNIQSVKSAAKVNNYYDDKFIAQIEEYLPHVERVSFLGGETFLINVFYDLWEKILKINDKILIYVLSNGTIYNERIENILMRGNFEVSLSIDSFNKETYNHIRRNADFEKTMINVEHFNNYMKKKGKSLTIDTCLLKDNWEEIPAIFEYCSKMNFNLFINYVVWPKSESLKFMTSAELDKIHNYYVSREKSINWSGNTVNKQVYKQILQQVENWKINAHKFECSELYLINDEKLVMKLLNSELNTFMEQEMLYLGRDESKKLITRIERGINNAKAHLSDNVEFIGLLKSLLRIPVYEIIMEGFNTDEDTTLDRFLMFR